MTTNRRIVLQATAAGLASLALPGWAQPGAATAPLKMKAVGLFALLGDTVQIAVSDAAPTDSRIERTNRDAMQFKGIGFDDIALRESLRWLRERHPVMPVQMYKATAPVEPNMQQTIADGAVRGELPDWIIKAIVDKQLDHVLLVTRSRGPIRARSGQTAQESIGRGTVQGVGFYIDTLYKMQNETTGALSEGLLAPFAKIRLSLMDTNEAKVVRQYTIDDSWAYAAKDGAVVADPWTFMDNAEKVRVLRQMVSDGFERALPQVFKP